MRQIRQAGCERKKLGENETNCGPNFRHLPLVTPDSRCPSPREEHAGSSRPYLDGYRGAAAHFPVRLNGLRRRAIKRESRSRSILHCPVRAEILPEEPPRQRQRFRNSIGRKNAKIEEAIIRYNVGADADQVVEHSAEVRDHDRRRLPLDSLAIRFDAHVKCALAKRRECSGNDICDDTVAPLERGGSCLDHCRVDSDSRGKGEILFAIEKSEIDAPFLALQKSGHCAPDLEWNSQRSGDQITRSSREKANKDIRTGKRTEHLDCRSVPTECEHGLIARAPFGRDTCAVSRLFGDNDIA